MLVCTAALNGESGIKKHFKGERFDKLFLYTKNRNNDYFHRVFPDKKLEALRDELTFRIDKLSRRNFLGINKPESLAIKPACYFGIVLGLVATELNFLRDLSKDPSEGALPFLIIPIGFFVFTYKGLSSLNPFAKKYAKLDKLVTIEKYVDKLLLEKDNKTCTD